MVKKVLKNYEITEEQFEELLKEYKDEHKLLFKDQISTIKEIDKEYTEYKRLIADAQNELDKLVATLYLPKINEDIPEQVKLLEKQKKLHTELINQKRKMLKIDCLEELIKIIEEQLKLAERTLEIIVENVINMNERALDLLCE